MEIREDIIGRRVLFNTRRGKRPHLFEEPEKKGMCFFCPGNESSTPKELMRSGDPWKWRIFPNKFPIVRTRHDILVESPDHSANLLKDIEVALAMEEAFSRYQEMFGKQYEYILYFKNSGLRAGASIPHTHSQIMALDFVPPEAMKRRSRKFKEYLEWEISSERALSDQVFMPYASIEPYETWIVPDGRDVRSRGWGRLLFAAMKSLSGILGTFSYNVVFFQGLRGMPFHIQILPRLPNHGMAGFEYGSGIRVNSVLPEKAAKEMRGRFKRNLRQAMRQG